MRIDRIEIHGAVTVIILFRAVFFTTGVSHSAVTPRSFR